MRPDGTRLRTARGEGAWGRDAEPEEAAEGGIDKARGKPLDVEAASRGEPDVATRVEVSGVPAGEVAALSGRVRTGKTYQGGATGRPILRSVVGGFDTQTG
jgi:hypothetical protein